MSRLPDKIQNMRGQYFHNAIHKLMAEKYNVPVIYISEIRRFAVHRKMSQQDICLYITEKLNSGIYDNPKKNRDTQKRFNKKTLKPLREGILRFLLKCSPDDFAEITRLTKWDWEYVGEGNEIKKRMEKINGLA